ncbi:hypothetical protein EAH72_35180, partial [Pseudomonas caspiana]
RHLRELGATARPTGVVSSPYRRSADTAELALATAGLATPVMRDERLRERELGLFDGLTGTGIRDEFGDERRRVRRCQGRHRRRAHGPKRSGRGCGSLGRGAPPDRRQGGQ